MILATTTIRKPEVGTTHGSLTVDLRVNPLLQRAQIYGLSESLLRFGTAFELMLL